MDGGMHELMNRLIDSIKWVEIRGKYDFWHFHLQNDDPSICCNVIVKAKKRVHTSTVKSIKQKEKINNNEYIKVQSEGLSLLFDYSHTKPNISMHCNNRLFAYLLDNYHLYDVNILP